MMYVRLEHWPDGDNTRATVLGEATVARVERIPGGDADSFGEYDCILFKVTGMPTLPGEPLNSSTATTWRKGRVTGFPLKRLGAWDLLYRALRSAVGDRNREPAPRSTTKGKR